MKFFTTVDRLAIIDDDFFFQITSDRPMSLYGHEMVSPPLRFTLKMKSHEEHTKADHRLYVYRYV